MLSIRLPQDLEDKLDFISKQEGLTKTALMKKALQGYILRYEQSNSPFDLGKDLFGKYGSKIGSLSKDYKKRVRKKIDEKISH